MDVCLAFVCATDVGKCVCCPQAPYRVVRLDQKGIDALRSRRKAATKPVPPSASPAAAAASATAKPGAKPGAKPAQAVPAASAASAAKRKRPGSAVSAQPAKPKKPRSLEAVDPVPSRPKPPPVLASPGRASSRPSAPQALDASGSGSADGAGAAVAFSTVVSYDRLPPCKLRGRATVTTQPARAAAGWLPSSMPLKGRLDLAAAAKWVQSCMSHTSHRHLAVFTMAPDPADASAAREYKGICSYLLKHERVFATKAGPHRANVYLVPPLSAAFVADNRGAASLLQALRRAVGGLKQLQASMHMVVTFKASS